MLPARTRSGASMPLPGGGQEPGAGQGEAGLVTGGSWGVGVERSPGLRGGGGWADSRGVPA
jgi:hypothetical protein